MSETPSQQPANPSPSPYMERYGYEPTYANLDQGIADMPDDQLNSLRQEYDQVFDHLSDSFVTATHHNPEHPGVNPVQEAIIDRAAERYMRIVAESDRRNPDLTTEERDASYKKSAEQLRGNIMAMNSPEQLDAIFSEYIQDDQLSNEELERASELADTIATKAYYRHRENGFSHDEAQRLGIEEYDQYLSKLGHSAIKEFKDERSDELAKTPEEIVDRSMRDMRQLLEQFGDEDEGEFFSVVKKFALKDLKSDYADYVANGGDEDAEGAQAARELISSLESDLVLGQTDNGEQPQQDEQAAEAGERSEPAEADEKTPEQAVARIASYLQEALDISARDDESDSIKRLSLWDLERVYQEFILSGGDEEAPGAQAARQRMEQLRAQLAKPVGDNKQTAGGEGAPKEPDEAEAAPTPASRRGSLSNADAEAIRAQGVADLAERHQASEAQKSPQERLVDFQNQIISLSGRLAVEDGYDPAEALEEVRSILEGLKPLARELPAELDGSMGKAYKNIMALRDRLVEEHLKQGRLPAPATHLKGRRGPSYTPNPIGGPSDRGRRGNRADDASRGVNLASGFGLSGNAREDFDTVKSVAARGARRVRSGASALNQRRQTAQQRRAEAQQARLNATPPPPAEEHQPNPDMPLPPPIGQYLRDLRPGEELPDAPTPPPPTEADASAPGSSQLPPPTGDFVRGPRDGEVLPPPPTVSAAQTQPEGPRPEEPRDAVLDYLAEKSPLFRLARAAEDRNRRGRQAQTQRTPPPPGPGDVAPGADLSSIPAPTDASANNTAEAA